jgi:hypothetical protein
MKGLLSFFLFCCTLVSAQIKGVVVNSKGAPIPYVNIWVENENVGTTSDENGIFKINTAVSTTIIFSAVGFEVKKIKIKYNEKVILEDVVYKLDEVTILKRKQDKELEIGDAKKIHHKQLSGDKPWIYGKLFQYNSSYSETQFLKKIIFFSDSEKKGAKLKIRLFEFNDTLPTNDILTEDLIVTVGKGMKKNEIDISKYNLKFPEKGIIIGLEWLIIEENKYVFEYKDIQTKKRVRNEYYAPSLVVNYSKEEHSFDYSGGKWKRKKIFQTDKTDKPWYNNVMMPAINLILSN